MRKAIRRITGTILVPMQSKVPGIILGKPAMVISGLDPGNEDAKHNNHVRVRIFEPTPEHTAYNSRVITVNLVDPAEIWVIANDEQVQEFVKMSPEHKPWVLFAMSRPNGADNFRASEKQAAAYDAILNMEDKAKRIQAMADFDHEKQAGFERFKDDKKDWSVYIYPFSSDYMPMPIDPAATPEELAAE